MRILLLTHAFNSLTQRLWADLTRQGHELSIEFDIADSVAEEAVALFRPDLIVCPYLRRAIPESVWRNHVCLVVHPGIVGDRGPSALDWAIHTRTPTWGVTVLQAEAEMDAGPVWAHAEFAMRPATKASLYRNEVTDGAAQAVLQAVARYAAGDFVPQRPAQGAWRPLMKGADRRIDWQRDDTATVLDKLRAADGFPGVEDELFGQPCRLFDAWPEATLTGTPGALLARRENALLRATTDGAVWIGHVRRIRQGEAPISVHNIDVERRLASADFVKLPATLAFAAESATLPDSPLSGWWKLPAPTWQDIAYEEFDGVGFLHFEFYNGAMSSRQCERLREALTWARTRPTKVLVLMGGEDFWSNGIHLNVIEKAESPADESWRNINAIDDLALDLIENRDQITVAAVGGNTGAGGCFLARAADLMWVRDGAILNPHYKNMGNLYGSEYWTYLLPRRVGEEGARRIMRDRLPLTAQRAVETGFADAALAGSRDAWRVDVARRAAEIAAAPDFAVRLEDKRAARERDEAARPLAEYRAGELAQMRRNFYGFDPSYHVARFHFVVKSLASWTPRHLARHRDLGWKT
ncbi:MAG: hydrogenase maturation protein [Sulfuritalea sp.]|nr:hydrogenase maturation protein [Sulfuritalea sp.]